MDITSFPPRSNIRVSVLSNEAWLPVVEDDEPLLLGGEDAPVLCTVGEAMDFLRQAAERPSWPLTTDPSNAALYAFEKAIEAYKVIGEEGLAGVVHWMKHFEAKLEPLEPPSSPPVHFDPYNEETRPEGFYAIAEARETRS